MHRPITDMTERQLLEAACRGDEDAFRRLVEPHRRGLRAHCDQMLGSLEDGEDALQDALLRAWRGLGRFEGRSSFRNWLYRIATNASLDALARRPQHAFPIDDATGVNGREGGGPVTGSVWPARYADAAARSEVGLAAPAARVEQRETAELAVVAALRHLRPRQHAVLILREVLGFSADEVAQALGTTVAAVNSALQRARKAIDERPPMKSRQASTHSLGDERLRELAHNVVDAFEDGDVAAIVSLLAEDAHSTLSPYTARYRRPRCDRRLVAHARSARSAQEQVRAA